MSERDINAIADDLQKTALALQQYLDGLKTIPAHQLLDILQKFPWAFIDIARELESIESTESTDALLPRATPPHFH